MVAMLSVPPAVVAALLGLLAGWVVAVVLLVVVAAAVAAVVLRGAERRVLTALGARPADPRADARVLNVVDGLCAAAGLRPPAVVVVERSGRNIAAVGRRSEAAALVVTSGLLGALTLMELEAVVATQVVRIRHGRMAPGTVASSLPAGIRRFVASDDPEDLLTDRAGVSLTRYPPALAGALEKVAADPVAIEGVAGTGSLWLWDAGGPGRVALPQRLGALRQL